MSTGINYLDEVWNPVTGCSGKSCPTKDTCWAKAMVKRFPAIHGTENEWGWLDPCGIPFEKVQFHPDRLEKPLHWKKPRRIGVCFLGDLFDERVPFEWVDKVMKIIAQCKNHSFFVLTKRPERMGEYFRHLAYMLEIVGDVRLPIPNLWNGVSITSQADADRMIPELLRIPGKHWVSVEPMLGPVTLFDVDGSISVEMQALNPREINFPSDVTDWVVVGCESGAKRRPCPHDWMIDVVEQCKEAGVPVWVKQIEIDGKVCTDITKFPEELQVRELVTGG